MPQSWTECLDAGLMSPSWIKPPHLETLRVNVSILDWLSRFRTERLNLGLNGLNLGFYVSTYIPVEAALPAPPLVRGSCEKALPGRHAGRQMPHKNRAKPNEKLPKRAYATAPPLLRKVDSRKPRVPSNPRTPFC